MAKSGSKIIYASCEQARVAAVKNSRATYRKLVARFNQHRNALGRDLNFVGRLLVKLEIRRRLSLRLSRRLEQIDSDHCFGFVSQTGWKAPALKPL